MTNVPALDLSEDTTPSALKCVNLRPAMRDGISAGLAPVGEFPLICRGGFLRPLCVASERVIAGVENQLKAIKGAGTPSTIGTTATPATCALGMGDDALVMTHSAPYRIGANDSVHAIARPAGHVSLVARDLGIVAVNVQERTLSRQYPDDGALADGDARAISDDYLTAFRRLHALGAAEGGYLWPVMARYRLLDARGRTLFVGPPVILASPSGDKQTGTVSLTGTDRRTTASYTLEATAYTIDIVTSGLSEEVSAISVEVSPQFVPYDTRQKCFVTAVRSGNTFVRVAPAVNCRSLSAVNSRGAHAVAGQLLGRLDALLTTACHTDLPVSGICTVCGNTSSQPETDLAAIDAVMRYRAQSSLGVSRHAGMPHSFVAEHCTDDGSTVLWANIRTTRFDGYAVTDFANTLPVKAGRGYIAVTFSNGERAVCDRSELPSCPGSFSPLLAYPDPGAISITIATESADGSIRTATYPMTPDSSGGWAYYLDANVRPVTPGGGAVSYNVPLPVRRQRVFAGTILVSPADSPLDIVAEVTLPEAVTAMCSPLRNDRSWEYGRSRYIVCTARAIYTLTVERGARSVTVRRAASPSGAFHVAE